MVTFTGKAGAKNSFSGSYDDDVATGGRLGDTLSGGFGNDSIAGKGGNDLLNGGFGFDTIFGDEGNDKIYGGSGDDSLSAGAGKDTIYGETGNDIIDAGRNSDMAGDYFDGGVADGADRTGVDMLIADFTGRTAAVTFMVEDPLDTVTIKGAFTFKGFEKFELTGGDGGDKIVTWAFNDLLHGGAGADTISGQGGEDTIYGDAGRDQLWGDLSADTIYGGADADTIRGGTGGDSLLGESGDDVIGGDKGDDTLDGGQGSDKLDGGEGADSLAGGSGDDTVAGGDGDDTLYGDTGEDTEDGPDLTFGDDLVQGGAGNDTIHDQRGADTLDGGAGDDVFELPSNRDLAADVFIGGDGFDKVSYDVEATGLSAVLDLTDQSKNDGEFKNDVFRSIEVFATGALDDALAGDSNDNIFYGGGGDDSLVGRSGDDTLRGGDGADVLDGGRGEDLFDFSDLPGETQGNWQGDVIVDFSSAEDDKLGFTTEFFGADGKALVYTDRGPATEEPSFFFNARTHRLWYDADGSGDGGMQLIATLLGVNKLGGSDFVLLEP